MVQLRSGIFFIAIGKYPSIWMKFKIKCKSSWEFSFFEDEISDSKKMKIINKTFRFCSLLNKSTSQKDKPRIHHLVKFFWRIETVKIEGEWTMVLIIWPWNLKRYAEITKNSAFVLPIHEKLFLSRERAKLHFQFDVSKIAKPDKNKIPLSFRTVAENMFGSNNHFFFWKNEWHLFS